MVDNTGVGFDFKDLMERMQDYYDSKSEIKKEVDKYNFFIRFLHHQYNKVHSDKWNILQCCVGLPRTGKSIFASFCSWLMYPEFEMNRDIVYTDKQFSQRITEIQKPGETIIWDEAGVGMPSREFYKVQNREIGKMLQTAGNQQPIVWFVTPDASFIDSQPKKLFHYFYECTERTSEYTKVKPYAIRVIRKSGKILYYYPRFFHETAMRIRSIRFYKPPESFIEDYNRRSDPNKVRIREKSDSLVQGTGAFAKKEYQKDINDIRQEVLKNPEPFQRVGGQFDKTLIYMMYRKQLSDQGNAEKLAEGLAKQCNKMLWNNKVKNRAFVKDNDYDGSKPAGTEAGATEADTADKIT
jgi:hypothetical protein